MSVNYRLFNTDTRYRNLQNSQVDHVDDQWQMQQKQYPVTGEQEEYDQKQVGNAFGQYPSIELLAAFLDVDVVAL